MNLILKQLLVPVIGAFLAGSGTALSGLDPTPYATEIGAAFGGAVAILLQSLRSRASDKTNKSGTGL